MKHINKKAKYLSAVCILIIFTTLTGCKKFLDVVPDDTPNLEHAFSNRAVMEKFMRTCYSHLPDATNPFDYPAYFTSKDEFDYRTDTRLRSTNAGMISLGLQNTNTPYQDYWSGRYGGKPLYMGIRECNIFLENAHKPNDITEEERLRWMSEVKFLKAYYHYFLMQLYGPIVLVKENLPVSANPEDLMVYREPVDECADYIVKLIDEAVPGLPPTLPDPDTEYGRISQVIALGIKAKVLALAASPLFNGNKDYAGWVDKRGKQLVSQTYDATKWDKVVTATKEAIELAHAQGYRVYTFNKYTGGSQTYAMNDSMVQLMTIRKAVTEQPKLNTGLIWATQEAFADGKGASNFFGNMLKSLFPVMYTTDQPSYVNYYSASWHMAELFYSNRGVPIEEDKYFDYANRYKPRRALASDNHTTYIPTGEITASMNFYREPRFYADLGFDRGYFEIASTTTNGGANFNIYLKHRPGELGVFLGSSSYIPKKLAEFGTSASQGTTTKFYTAVDYRFPLLRLTDLYLLYAEALNESKGPSNEAYQWIDLVRAAAGLKGVVESWQNASVNPGAPATKEGLRNIVQRERLIELAFEGQRFWDVRRWKIAEKYWSLPSTQWSDSQNPDLFYVPKVMEAPRAISFKDYLYPIAKADLRVNTNLIQTYGW